MPTLITPMDITPSNTLAWEPVDLTGYLGNDAGSVAGVMLAVKSVSTREFGCRSGDQTHTMKGDMAAGNIEHFSCAMDNNDIIELYVEDANITVYLLGYVTDDEGVFTATPTTLSYVATGWHDYTADASATFAFANMMPFGVSYYSGLRQNGQAEIHRSLSAGQWYSGIGCGCDGSGIYEIYWGNSAQPWYQNGYLTKNYTELDYEVITPSTRDAWTEVDVSSYVPAGAVGALVEFSGGAAVINDGGTRPTGSSLDGPFRGDIDTDRIQVVKLDGDRKFEAFLDTGSFGMYLLGYFTGPLLGSTEAAGTSTTTANLEVWQFSVATSGTGAATASISSFVALDAAPTGTGTTTASIEAYRAPTVAAGTSTAMVSVQAYRSRRLGHAIYTAEITVWDPGTGGYLTIPVTAGNYASALDIAAYAITDVDARIALSYDWDDADYDYFLSNHDGAGDGAGFAVGIESDEQLRFYWAETGVTPGEYVSANANIKVVASSGDIIALRYVVDADNGASDADVIFYWKATTPETAYADCLASTGWTQLGDTRNAGYALTINDSTATLKVGALNASSGNAAGNYYAAVLMDSIDGTPVFAADFTAQAEGTTSFTENSANGATVTINQTGDPQAEITSDAAETVLYYASGLGFSSAPGDIPANTHFDARIGQPLDVGRIVFAPGSTSGSSRVGYGDLVLINDDGALDALIDYGFDGRQIIIRRGLQNDLYPGNFTVVFTGTMEQPEINEQSVLIRVRERRYELDSPFQTTKYAGNNSLPDGLEGVEEDLKGKPKPILWGSVFNIAPPCVNSARLVYQVHDGSLEGGDVTAVYDNGLELSQGADYSSESDLLDDAQEPEPGYYRVYKMGGYFRLGSSPAGQITCDTHRGANTADRYPGRLFADVLKQAGFTAADYNQTDLGTLDTNAGYELGVWINSETTYRPILDDIAGSVGAWWAPDRDGVLRIKQLVAPSGTSVISFVADDLLAPIARIPTRDAGRGVPTYKTIVQYGKNYTVQHLQLLGEGSVLGENIADGAIDNAKLSSGCVSTSKVQNGAITTAKIGDLQVLGSKIGLNTLTADNMDELSGGGLVIDFAAEDGDPVLSHPSFHLNADGSADFDGEVQASQFTAAAAEFSGYLKIWGGSGIGWATFTENHWTSSNGLIIGNSGSSGPITFSGFDVPEVTGDTGGNAALQSLLSALDTLGLITDSTT